jgi:hypothetical protein
MFNLTLGEASYKHRLTVPDDLQYLSGGQLRDVYFEVGVTIVSLPTIQPANNTDCI